MLAGGDGGQAPVGAINIYTITSSRLRWTLQRLRFRTLRISQWRARNYSGREGSNITLRRLDILHSGTWLQLGRYPAVPGYPPEEHYHVLFCSNFTGEWHPYRQAFLDVLSTGIKSAWGDSTEFPKFPRRGARYRVEDWQRFRLPPTQHYYHAYPGVAPSEVRGAVRMATDLKAFALSAGAGDLAQSDDGLVTAFRQLQRRMTSAMGTSRSGIVGGAKFGPLNATGMSNFVSVVPILPGRERAVVDRIEALGDFGDSPFRCVEGTHFARLAVLDRRTAGFHPRRALELRHSWLLFAADLDGHFGVREPAEPRMDRDEVKRYVDAVETIDELRDVWQDCVGFTSDRPLADLIEPNVIRRFVLYLDHGDCTLRNIHEALRVKHTYLLAMQPNRLKTKEEIKDFLQQIRARGAEPQRDFAWA